MFSDSPPCSPRLQAALALAREAADEILRHFRSDGLLVEAKADESPVTIADRNAETLIREGIARLFPQDGILGEEFDDVPGSSEYRWIIDPIDGTKPFVHGVPLFGTLIGIERGGRMHAGVCHLPAMHETIFAEEQGGCWWQIQDQPPRRTTVPQQTNIAEARMMFTEPTHWLQTGRFDAIVEVMGQVRVARGWGDCFGHIMVATGRAEIAVDPLMSAWDIAALIPILREAGGSCISWKGREDIFGGDGVSVIPSLREHVLEVLGRAPSLS